MRPHPELSAPPRVGWRGRRLPWLPWLEPILLLALTPLFWFPRPLSALALLAIPALWLVRRAALGYFSVRTPYDAPFLCLLTTLPLTLIPIVDWSLATPKIYGVLLGMALVYALANALATRRSILTAAYLVAVGLGGSIAVVGLFGTEFGEEKLFALDVVYERLPLLVHGLVYAMPRGGIHPNETGGVLTWLLPLPLALLLAGCGRASSASDGESGWLGSPFSRGSLAVTWLLIGGVLFLTQSRSAYIGALASLATVGVWWTNRRCHSARQRVVLRLSGLAVLGIVSFWAARRLLASLAIPTTSTQIDSWPSRVEIWQRAFEMIQDFPFTGIGPGQFSLVVHTLYRPFLIPPDTYLAHAHNAALQMALDFGVPGTVALAFALGGFFRALWVSYRAMSDGQLHAVTCGVAAGMIGFLTYGMLDAVALGARGALPFWILLGLAAALSRRTRSYGSVATDRLPDEGWSGALDQQAARPQLERERGE